jgi:hypothetical protein
VAAHRSVIAIHPMMDDDGERRGRSLRMAAGETGVRFG